MMRSMSTVDWSPRRWPGRMEPMACRSESVTSVVYGITSAKSNRVAKLRSLGKFVRASSVWVADGLGEVMLDRPPRAQIRLRDTRIGLPREQQKVRTMPVAFRTTSRCTREHRCQNDHPAYLAMMVEPNVPRCLWSGPARQYSVPILY